MTLLEKRQADKDRYAELRANGLCVKCKQPSPSAYHAECRTGRKSQQRLRHWRNWVRRLWGYCTKCGENRARKGGTVCYDCKC